MVALGTTLSAFWIMVNNSWMQVPVGYVVQNGQFVPDDWTKIIFNSVVWSRFPHMLLASYLTGALCVASIGAWYLLRDKSRAEALVMLRMGLVLAAVLMPVQLAFGHLVGDYVHDFQPAKFAAIEGRWRAEQPASEVVIALPNPASVGLHEALGFTRVGVFPGVGFKNGTWWDVGWWHRRLAGPPAQPRQPRPWSELPAHLIDSALEPNAG